jgi:acyl-CoA thioester hydrolase
MQDDTLVAKDFLEEGFLIARVEMDYRKPIVLGDPVRVDLRVTQVGNSSFSLGYKVIRDRDEVVLAEAQTVQVTMDFQTQRPRPIRPQILTWLKTQL